MLKHTLTYFGRENESDRITEQSWEEFHRWLAEQLHWTPSGRHKIQGTARRFIQYLWTHRAIDGLPRNLDDRSLRFSLPIRTPEAIPLDEAKRILELASGSLRACLFLMANCGYTQRDVATLKHAEVDWEEGRVTRKRVKTAEHENVPVVSYLLWPETFRLLKEFCSDDPELVLVTGNGKPWVSQRIKPDGKVTDSDSLVTVFRYFAAKIGTTVTLKQFRKTSASLLHSCPAYRGYVPEFLGHAPRSIADRHYIHPTKEQLDEAVGWLGRQYGF
jgi:integrase